MKYEKNESGLLSLEASIALTIFIFLMLFMYSFFVIFEARNEIGHVLLSTANSLSLDAFSSDTLGDEESLQEIIYSLYGSISSGGAFTDYTDWYEDSSGGDSESESALESAVKTRFLAYLSGGDEEEANKILNQLNVVNGLEGLDFSQSKVEDGELFLVVEYKLEYEYQVFNLGELAFRQECCSKLWN